MIDGLRPYPETKPSGLPWLGDVPTHWQLRRAKRLLKQVDLPVAPEDEIVTSFRDGQVTLRKNRRAGGFMVALLEQGYQGVRAGQLVVHSMDAFAGAIGVSDSNGKCTPEYIVCDPREADVFVAYYSWVLRQMARTGYILAACPAVRERAPRLRYPDLGDLMVPMPTPDEQRLIVRFLDWHGAQTAKLIRAKKRIIALLNEEKQAIIHRAVTRGLDPNVKLRPSGIPWLGDVPKGWELKRLRNLADMRVSNVDKKSFDDEQPVRLCNYVDVYKNDAIHAEIPFMQATASRAEIERFRLRIDDVVITKDSEDWRDIGVPALVRTEAEDLVCAYHLALLRPGQGTDGAFLFWQLLAPHVRRQFAIAANGVTRYGLSHGSIKETVLLAPDLAEQRAIAAYLNTATSVIRRAEVGIQREITLVQEFRTRLIADVVAGKLDVRAAAADLPEVTDLEAVEEPADDGDLDEAIVDTENEEVAA